MSATVHVDRVRRLSSDDVGDHSARMSHQHPRDAHLDDTAHSHREPKRARTDFPSSDSGGRGRRGWRDVSGHPHRDRFDQREDDAYGRPQRWDRRDRLSAADDPPDVIRFLSTIPLPTDRTGPKPATPPSAFSSHPTRYLLLQNLPSSCDEAALHFYCHPFHCLRHQFITSTSSTTASCVVEFNEREWSKQFFVVHNDKLRLGGEQQQPVHMEYVHSDYVERHGVEGEKRKADDGSARKRPPQAESGATQESDQEEGEVDVEAEETPTARSARIHREYDLSSLTALRDARPSGVLVVSALPPEMREESLPNSADVIRYAFAPFVAVRWTAKERLRDSGEVVAFVAFHSAADAEVAYRRRTDVRLLGQPVTVHYARKADPQSVRRAAPNDVRSSLSNALSASASASTLPTVAPGSVASFAERPPHLPATYSYQADTGYWQDSASGLLYHPTTSMYFDPRTQRSITQHNLHRPLLLSFPTSHSPCLCSFRYLLWNALTQQYALVPQTDSTTSTSASASSPSMPSASPTIAHPGTQPFPAAKPTIRLSLSAATSQALSRLPPPSAPAPTPAAPARASESTAIVATTTEVATSATSRDGSHAAPSPSLTSSSSSSASPPPNAAPLDLSQVSPVLLSPLFDLTRVACLLCQRGFASLAQLQRHVEQSQLHAKTLEVHEAKEEMKRQRHDEQRKASVLSPSAPLTGPPTSQSITSHREPGALPVVAAAEMSVGERLMTKQGWRGAGHGLGKAEQGRSDIVQVSEAQSRAGIGAVPFSPALPPTTPAAAAATTPASTEGGAEAYKDLIRRKALERFGAVQSGAAAPVERAVVAATPPAAPALPDAARHYLSLLEKARATESEGEDHRRPLMK